MTHRILLLFLGVCLLCSHSGGAQAHPEAPDTVMIYKDKAGVSFRTYMHHWFFGYGIGHSYSWNPARVNKQYSLVIESHPPRYFKIYTSKNQLLFEGQSGIAGTELEGDVKYYYRSAQLKRIEHWDYRQQDSSCKNAYILFNDAPGPEGTWKYFRKNGTVKKRLDYIIKVYNCQPLSYCVIRQKTRLSKKGKTKWVYRKKVVRASYKT